MGVVLQCAPPSRSRLTEVELVDRVAKQALQQVAPIQSLITHNNYGTLSCFDGDFGIISFYLVIPNRYASLVCAPEQVSGESFAL